MFQIKRHIALMLCIACVSGLSGCANPYQQETSTEQTAEKPVSNSHNVRTNSLFNLQVELNKNRGQV